jgi:hypothetical protein
MGISRRTMPKYRVRHFYYLWEDEIVEAECEDAVMDESVIENRTEVERTWMDCDIEELDDADFS